MSPQNELRTLSRYLTTTDNNGKAVFINETDFPTTPSSRIMMESIRIHDCYSAGEFPVKLAQDRDLEFYRETIHNPPGIVVPNGSALRIVDLPPNFTSPMHKTISVNFNVVIEGEVELVLDSGETRLLKQGDSAVQRAINHAWRNPSATEWTRYVAIPLPAEL